MTHHTPFLCLAHGALGIIPKMEEIMKMVIHFQKPLIAPREVELEEVTAPVVCRKLREMKVFGVAFHVEKDGPYEGAFRVYRKHHKKGFGRYITALRVVPL